MLLNNACLNVECVNKTNTHFIEGAVIHSWRIFYKMSLVVIKKTDLEFNDSLFNCSIFMHKISECHANSLQDVLNGPTILEKQS